MDPGVWTRIEAICAKALDIDPSERASFVAGACGGDAELQREVESLLSNATREAEFLSGSALELAAHLLVNSPRASLIGRRIGPYDVVAVLGAGGMSEVYRAHDVRLGRDVALKVLAGTHADLDRRFEQEARAAAALNHPNIVALYDVGVHDGAPYLVTELLDGETLAARLSRIRMSPPEALAVARQIAGALAAAHDKGIVHRDLKPANVFLMVGQQVKVLDFGLADRAGGAGRAGKAGGVQGTAAYMSPEQAQGGGVDARSDIFSFGTVLYEMLAGRRPFTGDSQSAVLDAIVNGDPAPIDIAGSALLGELALVALKCLNKKRVGRFLNGRELLDALAAIDAKRAAGTSTSRPRWRWAAAAAVITVLGATLWAVRAYRRDVRAAAGATMPTGDRPVWTGFDVDGYGSISSDGRFLTWVDWNRNVLMLRDLVAGTNRRLTQPGADTVEFSVISKDGKQVVFEHWNKGAGKPSELRVASLEGAGVPASRVLFANDDIVSIHPRDWSRDGRWVSASLAISNIVQVALVDARDGTLRVLKSLPPGRIVGSIFFSPDGQFVAYDATGDPNERDIFIIGTDGTRDTDAIVHAHRNKVMGWSPDGRHLLFASDRSGSTALWALPIAEGRPAGAAFQVRAQLESSWPLGVGASGTLFVWQESGAATIQAVPIDLEAGTLGAPDAAGFQHFIESRGRPDWSPNGQQLSFVSCGPLGGGSPGCTLYIQSFASGEVRELHLPYVFFPRWSPDGTRLIAQRGGVGRPIVIIDPQSGAVSDVGVKEGGSWPQWARDGRTIFYSRDAQIFERVLDSGVERALPLDDTGRVSEFALSPDDRSIAVTTTDSSRDTALWIAPRAGGSPRLLLQPKAGDRIARIAWAPDATSLIVATASAIDTTRALAIVPVNGASPRPLRIDVSKWNLDEGFRLSPDGRRIAFVAAAGPAGSQIWALDSFLSALSDRAR